MTTNSRIDKHYTQGNLMRKVLDGLKQAGKDLDALTVDDLAPVDEFHTRGRDSTTEVAALADLVATDLVLDVGCGMGGTARHLAERYGCRVVGLDITEEYITVGQKLNEMVGLADWVDLHHGSALEMPFGDDQFDVVWTEHVQMNIVDKDSFYTEIARVLKPGGRLLFHDIFRGGGDAPIYPAPWAEDETLSSLVTETEARAAIAQAGLQIDRWIGKVPESAEFFERVSARIEAQGPPPLGIHLLMGSNACDKLRNQTLNLREDRVAVTMGMARKK